MAAGSARRFGGAKLAATLDGAPVVARTHAAIAAAGLPVLAVTGDHAAAVLAALPGVPHAHAPDHARGLSASLRAGLLAAPPGWDGALVCLADMPWVRPATYAALAAALGGAPAVFPVHAGQRGNPAGFTRACWPRLLALDGDRGAGGLLGALGAVALEVDDPGVLLDVDRPADLQR